MKKKLTYLSKIPTKTNSGAAIFLLHGYGSNEADLFSFASYFPNDYYIFSFRAPIALDFGYAWYNINFNNEVKKWSDPNEAIYSRDLILENIEFLIEKHNLDAKKITLLGFSQGAVLSWSIALTYPTKIDKVIGLSGCLFLETINLSKNNIENIKGYISHGVEDNVIPLEWAKKSNEHLKELGVDVKYEEFPTGHTVSQENLNSLLNWLGKIR